MNMVKSYFSNPGSADVIKYFSKYPARENYSAVGNNNVLINVWGYDNAWTIKATENGIEREVKHIRMEDPLHTISYDIPRAQTADLTDSFVTNNTVHMFMVEALLPDSSIDIEVTDRFGNVYRELMQRPKAFNWTTK